jgi:hypothetical protein
MLAPIIFCCPGLLLPGGTVASWPFFGYPRDDFMETLQVSKAGHSGTRGF